MSSAQALVILSGGQDSTTCLYEALHGNRYHFEKVHAITFDYGQKHSLEVQAAKKIAKMAGVASHEIIEVPSILKGKSPLVNPNIALETYPDFESMDKIIGDRVELTFVPMRNPLFLTIAANRAACLGDHVTLFTGVCQMDNANYPDCREDFLASMMTMIKAALGPDTQISICAPLLYLSKAESVLKARELPGCLEALAHSHTCYTGIYPPCGVCHACVLRAEGFRQAAVADPLIERALNEEATVGTMEGTQQSSATNSPLGITPQQLERMFSIFHRRIPPSLLDDLYNVLSPPTSFSEWSYKLSSER